MRRVLRLPRDLVDLVDVDDAALALRDVEVGGLKSLTRMFSTSSPTYPASVSVVASAMVNGTSRIRASVCASSVLPDAGRADQQDVGLLQLDVAVAAGRR